jgi:imidazole glycerol-phosphate synthase subunit HisF
MLAKRIIPCLDVKNGKVVKGINFNSLQYAGNAVELAEKYSDSGADELIFLDITASIEKRKTMIELVKKVAEKVFIPFTVGGGINSIKDINELLKSGADKVSLNTSAIKNPELIKKASKEFGAQCIVIAIDAKKMNNSWNAFIYGGKQDSGLNAIEWAKKAVSFGAGEILLTSMNADGTKKGFDLNLTKKISEEINVPVIASGGAGTKKDFLKVFQEGKADAALAASIFHYNNYSVQDIKNYLKKNGVVIR